MFISAFFVDSFSRLYFSSITHAYPFFLGSLFATLSGVYETTARFKKKYTSLDSEKDSPLYGRKFCLARIVGLSPSF